MEALLKGKLKCGSNECNVGTVIHSFIQQTFIIICYLLSPRMAPGVSALIRYSSRPQQLTRECKQVSSQIKGKEINAKI